MKKKIYSLVFPLFFSLVPSLLYLLLNTVNMDIHIIKFSILIFFVNLGWISFIHFFKKGQTLILSIYIITSLVFTTYIIFVSLKIDIHDIHDITNIQYLIIYSLLIIGIIGLSFFIKRKEKKGEI